MDKSNIAAAAEFSQINNVMLCLFVAPHGNDSHTGSQQQPFKSVEKAIDIAADNCSDMYGDIIICISGRIFIDKAITIDHKLSGTNGYKIILKGKNDRSTYIVGGKEIRNFEDADEIGTGVVKAYLEDAGIFRQFYINEERRQIAKNTAGDIWLRASDYYHPNRKAFIDGIYYEPTGEFTEGVPASEDTGIFVNTEDVLHLKIAENSHIEFQAQYDWVYKYIKIKNVYELGERSLITFDKLQGLQNITQDWPPKRTGQPYRLINHLSFLTEEGEWFFDQTTEYVYYKLKKGETIDNINACYPISDAKLLSIEGTKENPVSSVEVSSISFMYNNWTRTNEVGFNDLQALNYYFLDENLESKNEMVPGAITIDYTEKIKITNCTFANLATTAIVAVERCAELEISNNIFKNLAAGGIQIGTTQRIENDGCYKCRVFNNVIDGVGRDFGGAVGISFGYVNSCEIIHNEICHTNYTGISVGWGWTSDKTFLGNIRIAFNHIHDVMENLADGAAIYLLSRQDGTLIENNYIHDIKYGKYVYPHEQGKHKVVYLDEGAQYVTARNNYVLNLNEMLMPLQDKDSLDYPKAAFGAGPQALGSNDTSKCFEGSEDLAHIAGVIKVF